MKEDYLWDKTGSDAEIERLENALSAFRYRETAAPALPAKVVPLKIERKTRAAFRLTTAIAAGLILALISAGVWLQFRHKQAEIKPSLAEATAPQVETLSKDVSQIIESQQSTLKKTEAPKPKVRREVVIDRKFVKPIPQQSKTVVNNLVAANQKTVKLTKEEKYAYDQLMLALSITSSTLKTVKDKAESRENTEDIQKNGR